MTLVGKKIRHFNIVAALGRGGMGDVYVGYDENLKRKVAIKAIQAGRGLTPQARARFLREAQILSQLDHPGICRIYDYIEFEGNDYLVLELIEGRTLIEAAKGLDFRTRMDIAEQIAQVLDIAHGEGIVHRDLKPDNVMLTAEGQVKLLDFGLAHSLIDDTPDPMGDLLPAGSPGDDPGLTIPLHVNTTLPGTILGTPLFMSPEQANLEPVSPASDMFSFGLLLQWLFTGSYAYENTQDIVVMVEQARAARTLPVQGVDRDLASLIERLESRSPARRPTALATRERLDWIGAKPTRRNRRFMVAAVVVAILLAGFKYTTDLRSERMKAEYNRAQAEDLMGFMLGDLRDKLEPVGRLDVLDDVGAKALEYYAARRSGDLEDGEFFKLAKAMMQIGEVRMAQGDLEAAREAFDQALVTSENLVDGDPANTSWLAGLGAVHFWIGSIDYGQGRLDEAEDRFVTYLEIGRRLVDMEPSNTEWRLEVGFGYTNLAALAEERGQYGTALEFIQSSIGIKRELAEMNPGDPDLKYSLANSLGWAGRMGDHSGNYPAALAALQEARIVIADLISADPANTTYQDLMSVTLQILARLQSNLGLNEEALKSFRADLAIISRLATHDPENAGWRSDLATSQRTMGLHLLRENRVEEARGMIHEGHGLILELLDQDPQNAEHHYQLAYSRIALAHLALAENRPAEAVATLDRSLADIPRQPRDGDDLQSRLYLGRTYLWRGIALAEMGRQERAATDWEQAKDILEPLRLESREPEFLVEWTRLMALLGEHEQSRETATRLAAMDFARSDFVGLCRDFDLIVD